MTGSTPTTGDAPAPAPWSRYDPMSSTDYRTVLGKVPTSVAVIAAVDGDEPVGVAVGSLTSVSLDPPLVGFFIARTSSTWPRIEPTGGFCASVLSEDQAEHSRVFATRGADKFAGLEWRFSPAGRPMVLGASAWFDCSIHAVVPAGDHWLVLGRIDAMEASAVPPLVFLGGRYGAVVERVNRR